MSDKAVADAVDGIGVQCYRDNMASAEMLDILREKYKNKFIINTEFCFVQRLDSKSNCDCFDFCVCVVGWRGQSWSLSSTCK